MQDVDNDEIRGPCLVFFLIQAIQRRKRKYIIVMRDIDHFHESSFLVRYFVITARFLLYGLVYTAIYVV